MLKAIFGDQNPHLQPGKVYLWTNSIRDGRAIFLNSLNREIIVKTLRKFVWQAEINVYAFVIMPNHVHLVWEVMAEDDNISESFRRETTSQIIENLKVCFPESVKSYHLKRGINNYNIWRKRPKLAELNSNQQIKEAISYIHENPVFDRWGIVKSIAAFKWSSAKFYESGNDTFGFLSHYQGYEEKLRGMV
ncbi:MAG: hypothetical protein RIC06_13975 [Cyclobacteriaceae bacterium]